MLHRSSSKNDILPIKWCCAQFRNYYHEAGKRGLGIAVCTGNGGRPMFLLQFRAIDKDVIVSFKPEVPLSFSGQTGILHCPWCGKELQRVYAPFVAGLKNDELDIANDAMLRIKGAQ